MYRPAIVAVAYDRPQALKRLLSSIEAAKYPDDVRPVLVISIDKSDSDDVVCEAKSFEYTHGDKVILERPERMGLRRHVLSCGDLTKEYGSIIVLEDDLFVSPDFYNYACAVLDFSDDHEDIGSVSLYNHLFNVHTREAFYAIDDGYDNYYLQIASSWGQAYTKKQWELFKEWYEKNSDRDLAGPDVPLNISGWSDKSWLKYYIVYLIETGRYTIYPRTGMTTNFGDVGTHACKIDTDLQVPISASGSERGWCFSTVQQSQAVYDPFFELKDDILHDRICPGDSCLIVDLYGSKPVNELILLKKKAGKGHIHVLSSQRLPFKAVRSFGRQMRPVDANAVYGIEGNDLFLYDTGIASDPPAKKSAAIRFLYDYRGISAARMIRIIIYRIMEKLGIG